MRANLGKPETDFRARQTKGDTQYSGATNRQNLPERDYVPHKQNVPALRYNEISRTMDK